MLVKAGRYGPYVSHDGVNATLPKDKPPETITLDEALVLLAARAAQGGEGRDARRGQDRQNRPAGRRRRRRPARQSARQRRQGGKPSRGECEETDRQGTKVRQVMAKAAAPKTVPKTHQGGKVRRASQPR